MLIGCTWVSLGLEVVSWQLHIPTSSVNLAGLNGRWSCYLDFCVGAALRPGRIAACDCRVQSKYSVLQFLDVRDPILAY